MTVDGVQPRRLIALTGGNLTYFRGLEASLDHRGWNLVRTDDPRSWASQPGERIVLVRLDHPEHDVVIRSLPRTDAVTIVALSPDPIAEDLVGLVRAGATTVIDANADPDHIALIIDLLTAGHAVMPLVAQHRLIAMARSETDKPALADEEVKWLQLLAEGRNAPAIAAIEHRSVRSMQRALTAVYRRIGVEGRPQAIAWAARHNLLD